MTVLEQNACNAIIAMAKKDEPDYWTKLEHQYAGMAMQGMLANANHYLWERKQNYKSLVANAAELAHALVEKMRQKEE